MRPYKIGFRNFSGFLDYSNSFFPYVFTKALNTKIVLTSPQDADCVLWSCFPITDFGYASYKEDFPVIPGQKHIYYTAENFIAPLDEYDAGISFEFRTDPRHARLPCWLLNCDWRLDPDAPSYSDYGLNPYRFHLPRKVKSLPSTRSLSAFIGFQQPNRESVLAKLKPHLQSNLYGSVYENKVLNKIALKERFTFNLCFENSLSTGYHTEKIPHAWEMRAVPLYWGSTSVSMDFNKKSLINMADFSSEDAFVERVISLSDEEIIDIIEQPLVTQPITIRPIIDFIAGVINK